MEDILNRLILEWDDDDDDWNDDEWDDYVEPEKVEKPVKKYTNYGGGFSDDDEYIDNELARQEKENEIQRIRNQEFLQQLADKEKEEWSDNEWEDYIKPEKQQTATKPKKKYKQTGGFSDIDSDEYISRNEKTQLDADEIYRKIREIDSKIDGDTDDVDWDNWDNDKPSRKVDSEKKEHKKEFHKETEEPKKYVPDETGSWEGWVDDEEDVKPKKKEFWQRDGWDDDAEKPEFTQPTMSIMKFQNMLDHDKVIMSQYKNPNYNTYWARSIEGVSVSDDGKHLSAWVEFQDENMKKRGFGTPIVITKSCMAEVLNCIIIILETASESNGDMFAGDELAIAIERYIDTCLTHEDKERMDTIMNMIAALKVIRLKNINQIKNFVKWYNDNRIDWAMVYYRDAEDKNEHHSKFEDGKELMLKYRKGLQNFKLLYNEKIAKVMTNICTRIKYNQDRASEFKPPKSWNDKETLVNLYVAGLINMQKRCPETKKDIVDIGAFKYIGGKALRLGATMEDIEDVYLSCVN